MFIRRDLQPATRHLVIRVALLFFAAGVWIAGVVVGDDRVTGAAIVVATIALLLGLLARRARSGGNTDDVAE
jgi:di/tricarboxylate transporter